MKKYILFAILFAIIASPVGVHALQGYLGYEGGISSGYVEGQTSLPYKEVCFITGKPLILSGTVIIKKSLRDNIIKSTHTYNLTSETGKASLKRTMTYETEMITTDKGQNLYRTYFSRKPSEIIEINGSRYMLDSYDFSHSSITDHKSAVDYTAGNIWGKKVYNLGTGGSGGTVTVEITGESYGYDQYWCSNESGKTSYYINYAGTDDNWGGYATVSFSSVSSKQLKYSENLPQQISFSGGYIQIMHNSGMLEYTCGLPEFDSEGISTDNIKEYSDSISMETFPLQERLPVSEISNIRGHWAENDFRLLYSLGVFEDDSKSINPDEAITRLEFADAIVRAAREVPKDPALNSKTSRIRTSRTGTELISPFKDISVKNVFFDNVKNAYERGLMNGKSEGIFAPNETITMAETIEVFVRALGLENLGPGPGAVTLFKDNDNIPSYFRNSAYVAQKIGLVEADERGRFKPNEYLTKASAAVLLNRLINYMRDDLEKDYRYSVYSW